jgi:hypothetical protein
MITIKKYKCNHQFRTYWNVNGYYVSNEGTKNKPNYHVWVPSVTHADCDSAYDDITLAVCRCDYLAEHKVKLKYQPL